MLGQIRPWAPTGRLELAGGTNASTAALLPPDSGVAGVAFGGMARSLLQPLLLQAEARGQPLRHCPDLVMTLRMVYGFRTKEIARELGISDQTVKAQLAKGMRRTADYLAEYEDP